jgi:hypothetical protein
MAQEPVNLIDRDTLIAAILTGQWGGDAGSPEEAVEAFRQTLVALRAAGGAVSLWNNADPETED